MKFRLYRVLYVWVLNFYSQSWISGLSRLNQQKSSSNEMAWNNFWPEIDKARWKKEKYIIIIKNKMVELTLYRWTYIYIYSLVVLYICCMQFIKYCSEFDSRNSWTTGPKLLIVLKLKKEENNRIIKYIHIRPHGWRLQNIWYKKKIIIHYYYIVWFVLNFYVINFGLLDL